MAYFTNQDRERQATRQMKRDEVTMGRQQLADALAHAERYGVGPGADRLGWTKPEDQAAIKAAIDRYKRGQQAEAEKLSLAADEAEMQRYQALVNIAGKLDERRRGVARSLIDGTGTLADAKAAGIDEADAIALFAEGDQRRKAAAAEAAARQRREAERDQREAEWHQRRMTAPAASEAKPKGNGGGERKAPTSQADLDRAFANSQRKAQGLPPLPDLAKPSGPSAADLWGELDRLMREEAGLGAELPRPDQVPEDVPDELRGLPIPPEPNDEAIFDQAPAEPQPAPAVPRAAPPVRLRVPAQLTKHRAALDRWLAGEGAMIANGVRAAGSARAQRHGMAAT